MRPVNLSTHKAPISTRRIISIPTVNKGERAYHHRRAAARLMLPARCEARRPWQGRRPRITAGEVDDELKPDTATSSSRFRDCRGEHAAGSRYGNSDDRRTRAAAWAVTPPCTSWRGAIRLTGTDAWELGRAVLFHPPRNGRKDLDPSIIWEEPQGRSRTTSATAIIEKLHNLEVLPADGFIISCFPHKIRGASAEVDEGGRDLRGVGACTPWPALIEPTPTPPRITPRSQARDDQQKTARPRPCCRRSRRAVDPSAIDQCAIFVAADDNNIVRGVESLRR